ncbi:hypothetical protein BC835DRAFT_1418390 [Cytidiella melzeri]|nr:hypothetical protein BC835DRAFT_1418390 [Cytidiella melzeri]
MTSVVVQEPARDIPHLSVTVDHTTSSSPFPSPGSPFLPPPKLNAHEFAAKPVDQIMRAIETKRKSSDQPNGASQTLDGESTPTIHLSGPASSPATPTPTSFQTEAAPPPKVTIPDLPPTQSDKLSQRESLTSSRPAPPSPAASRRTSAAQSSLYARSRPQSRVTSLSQSMLPIEVQTPVSASDPPATAVPPPPPKRRSLLVKIRDFAFASSDDRHVGKGSDVPRPNRPRHRGSTYSSASSSGACDEEDVDEEDQQRGGWSSFRWNTLSQHFWGNKRAEGQEEAGPSRMDFDRNFEVTSPAEPEYEEEENDEGEEEYLEDGDDEPLVPGMYRALYAFEPEGTAEMALVEDQVVRVIGKGGGVGWAIVEREDGGHALVPESYLEPCQLDEESDDHEA